MWTDGVVELRAVVGWSCRRRVIVNIQGLLTHELIRGADMNVNARVEREMSMVRGSP